MTTSTALSFTARPASLAQAFEQYWHAHNVRDLPTLTDGARTLTYAQLAHETGAIAANLSGRDARPGDVVVIAMERSIDAGPCPCVIEPKLSAQEVSARLAETQARFLVHDAEHAALLDPLEIPGATRTLDIEILKDVPYFPLADVEADCPALLFTSGNTVGPRRYSSRRPRCLAMR
ncbi:Long-chain-fatty-acid-CoA ligase [Candidatus Paraburkholderia calva]|nr:Long-chain-fatty-acid-CoA ligase [Candidatus Paraburkholderia calva]